MEGHLLAPMLEENPPEFPFVALLVSGGHTQLISVTGIGKYELLGESIDDAAGEAFDKTAKLRVWITRAARCSRKWPRRARKGVFFPRPMTDRPGLDFSFSGLKTFAANTIRNNDDSEQTRADIARAFEDAVVDTLMIGKRALDQTGFKRTVMAGGVSANRTLRAKLAEMMQKRRGEVFYARPEFCTDNGAMIAYAGMVRLSAGATADLSVSVRPRWPLAELPEAIEAPVLAAGRRLHPDLKHLVLDDQRVKLAIVLYVQLFHRRTLCALTVLMLKCINCAISFKFNPYKSGAARQFPAERVSPRPSFHDGKAY